MIDRLREGELDQVMSIWLEANKEAHGFVAPEYWEKNFAAVRATLPQAEVCVSRDSKGRAEGFIGLEGDYIAGIFVRNGLRSKGIGRRLLDHAKASKSQLRLHVYKKNTRAVNFYKREAFRVEGEQTDSQTGEQELLCVWRSDAP